MEDILIYGLIIIASLAVIGLGIKVSLNIKGGKKVVMKNLQAGGDIVGGDKKTK